MFYSLIAIGAAQIGVIRWGSLIAAPSPSPTSDSHLTVWDALIYRTKAVQLITERVTNSKEAISDALIVAVSIVMMTEVKSSLDDSRCYTDRIMSQTIMGQTEYISAHMKGLKRMIVARGGLDKLPSRKHSRAHS